MNGATLKKPNLEFVDCLHDNRPERSRKNEKKRQTTSDKRGGHHHHKKLRRAATGGEGESLLPITCTPTMT